MLYQLSYFRLSWRKMRKKASLSDSLVGGGGLEPPNPEGADLQSAAIATMRSSQSICCLSWLSRADRGIRTHDPEITNHVLWPTELYRQSFQITPFPKGTANIEIYSQSPKIFQSFSTIAFNSRRIPSASRPQLRRSSLWRAWGMKRSGMPMPCTGTGHPRAHSASHTAP